MRLAVNDRELFVHRPPPPSTYPMDLSRSPAHRPLRKGIIEKEKALKRIRHWTWETIKYILARRTRRTKKFTLFLFTAILSSRSIRRRPREARRFGAAAADSPVERTCRMSKEVIVRGGGGARITEGEKEPKAVDRFHSLFPAFCVFHIRRQRRSVRVNYSREVDRIFFFFIILSHVCVCRTCVEILDL